ncbi:response regulator [soil metagenome]
MKELRILQVEDNEGDIILTVEALKEANVKHIISVAMDGQEALDLLRKTEELPDLILLDINLPKIDGIEVLSIIKKEERLMHIPVIILSTSSTEKDILSAYNNFATSFITKPLDLNKFLGVLESIGTFSNDIQDNVA